MLKKIHFIKNHFIENFGTSFFFITTSLSFFSIILIIYIFSLLFIYFYHLNDNFIIFIVTVFKIITHIDIYCLMSSSKFLSRSEDKKEAQAERESKFDSMSDEVNTQSSDNINKFIDDFDIKSFIQDIYDYLDTLTQIEELSLLHTLIFVVIILNLYSILGVFFGNELIKYFDLENKFPKLAFYFKLRTKFQRYYLIWNIFASFILCILALTLDVLTFIH